MKFLYWCWQKVISYWLCLYSWGGLSIQLWIVFYGNFGLILKKKLKKHFKDTYLSISVGLNEKCKEGLISSHFCLLQGLYTLVKLFLWVRYCSLIYFDFLIIFLAYYHSSTWIAAILIRQKVVMKRIFNTYTTLKMYNYNKAILWGGHSYFLFRKGNWGTRS